MTEAIYYNDLCHFLNNNMESNKKNLLIVGMCLYSCLFCCCQNTLKVRLCDYKVEEAVNVEQERAASLWYGHEESMWANHLYYRNAGDSVIRAVLSYKQDTLFALIYPSLKFQCITLDKMPRQSISSVYYHNNDSIFIFYDRVAVLRSKKMRTDDWVDFALMDNKGNLIQTYRMDSVPDIYNGSHWSRVLKPVNADMPERIFKNGILLNFEACYPWVTQKEYDSFNPPLVALYDLENGSVRMLNIRPPGVIIGKQYGMWSGRFWVRKSHNGKTLIGFHCLPNVYEYDWKTDSMFILGNSGCSFFRNTDSASMEKGKDYPLFCFNEPEWLPACSCYIRCITVTYYPGYKPYGVISELIDSNFNHVAYLSGNKGYSTPNATICGLNTFDKMTHRPHVVQLKKRIRKINMDKFLSFVLEKKEESLPSEENMTVEDYLQALHLSEGSLILLINLKYPCGHCMDYLFSQMDSNRSKYAENNIYYVVYNPETNGLLESYLKRHHLEKSKNIISDNVLLKNVHWMDNNMADEQFVLIDYRSTDKKYIRMIPLNFDKLPSTFEEWVSRQVGLSR